MKLPSPANILLLGGGGRESALAWKIAQSKELGKLYIAPGNAGTSLWGTNIDIDPLDFSIVKQFVLQNFINLVVVGPEAPLVRGIRDFFREDTDLRHIPVIGPSSEAAKLEGSKEFAKEFMRRYNIPTARYMTATKENLDEADRFLQSMPSPYVLKADGLAAGKGVLIIEELEQAKTELREMLSGKFGKASEKVVIEEYLKGEELSVFAVTDGRNYLMLPEAKDYKRIGDGDTGPNTGGMGAISPVDFADPSFMQKVQDRIIEPTISGIQKEKLDYIGFIFVGLMNCDGEPFVIEYNVRMGDPEAEVIIPRIESDLIDLFDGIANKTLYKKNLHITTEAAATVICASQGYPSDDYLKGVQITGLDSADEESLVFHSGTKMDGDKVITSGGRVLAITSLAKDVQQAVEKSYRTIEKIDYSGKTYRRDIGK